GSPPAPRAWAAQRPGSPGLRGPLPPLDTLPKEDLIKFAKKQVMLIQKVKSRVMKQRSLC
uniref:Uncharacterized protein n=1 Tax=Nothoprocta perdicaria TaxID=30464 RepID=A0A8C7ECX8_NOTPE